MLRTHLKRFAPEMIPRQARYSVSRRHALACCNSLHKSGRSPAHKMRAGPNILSSRTLSRTGDVALPTQDGVTITGDDLSEGDTALSRRTQQIAIPLKRDDCSSHRTAWAGWASVSHPVTAGPLFSGITQNGLGWTGLRSRCSERAVFSHRTEWGGAGLAYRGGS